MELQRLIGVSLGSGGVGELGNVNNQINYMIKRIFRIISGLLFLAFGMGLGIGLYLVLSDDTHTSKEMGEMAFGIFISFIGAPLMIGKGIQLIFFKPSEY
jgi:hypothetical protein